MPDKLKRTRFIMGLYCCVYTLFFMKAYNNSGEFNKYSKSAPEKDRSRLRFFLDAFFYGASAEDYFVFRFYNKTRREKREYVTVGKSLFLHNRLNDKAGVQNTADKSRFYEAYRPFLGRDVMAISGQDDRAAFEAMCRKYGQLILKPRNQDCGTGVHKVSVVTDTEIETAWREALENHLLAEEVMRNHPVIAAFHPDSLNTFRVYVLVGADGEPQILGASLRCGNNGNIVDNAAGGGMYAVVDPVTGVIFSDGLDIYCTQCEYHPYTGVRFKGTAVPNWGELRRLAAEAARVTPGLRLVGWDWVLKADGSWALQEGNCPGGYVTIQTTKGVGVLDDVLDILFG